MSSFTQGLKDKIGGLRDEREELEDSMSRIDTKIETLEELLAEEEGTPVAKPTTKRKRGRPKSSKKTAEVSKRDKELYDEAVATLPEAGTTPEMQERLVNRYRTTPGLWRAGDQELQLELRKRLEVRKRSLTVPSLLGMTND